MILLPKGEYIISKSLRLISSEREKYILDYVKPVSYTHLRAHETVLDLVCRLLLEKKQKKNEKNKEKKKPQSHKLLSERKKTNQYELSVL